jgi:hypothetical protein|tara:strand:+ start:326 stop:733 length:408 start_codon:yes stop_codon:yes gene_type:complete
LSNKNDEKLTKDEIEKLVSEKRLELESKDEHIPITEEYAYLLVLKDFRNSFVGIENFTSKGLRKFSMKSKKPVENEDVSETTKVANMKRRLTNAKNKNIVGVDRKNGYRIANIKTTYLIKSNKKTYRIIPNAKNS